MSKSSRTNQNNNKKRGGTRNASRHPAQNNNDCAYPNNEERSLEKTGQIRDLPDRLHDIDHSIVKVKLDSIPTDLKSIEENVIIKTMLDKIANDLNRISRARLYVSGYRNTDKIFYSHFNKKSEKVLYKRLYEAGSREFGISPSSPFGLLEFSEVFDNKYLMQINLDCEDEENNNALRFYIVQKHTLTEDEAPYIQPDDQKNTDYFLCNRYTDCDKKTGKQYEQLYLGRDLRYLCKNIQEDLIKEIKTIILKEEKELQAKRIVELIDKLKAKIDILIKHSPHPDGEIYAVIVAKQKTVADKRFSIFFQEHMLCGEKQGLPDKSQIFWMSKDNDSPVAVFPMSCQINQDRLTHLIYFNYLLFKILAIFSKKESKRCFNLFIPEQSPLPRSNRLPCGIMLWSFYKMETRYSHSIAHLISQVFRPIHTAMLIQSSKLGNLKSAVGSIMSRNGSHNIGSHVLSALSHQIGTMPDDRVFYQYIQQRMGYIANVTTGFPSWTTSTMLVGDMMRTFFFQKHLLEYIADSEGLHAYRFRDPNGGAYPDEEQSDTIKICVRRVDYDKDAKVTHFVSFYNCKPGAAAPNSFEQDVALAIPGGIVGQHAFFTILENIIRNAAKHGWATKKQNVRKNADNPDSQYDAIDNYKEETPRNLEIHISFKVKKDDDTIEFTIWDNVSDVFSPFLKKDGPGIDLRKIWTFLRTLSEVEDENSPSFSFTNAVFPNKTAGSKDDSLFSANHGIITRKQWIKSFFPSMKDEDKHDPLKEYDSFDGILKEWEEATKSVFFDYFLYKTPLNKYEIERLKSIDYKSCVPLNMQQEILLSQPLINESGELQRENWGMAEMRISAGYLRGFTVEQIGGLKPIKSGDYMIRAIAVRKRFSCPRNTAGDMECSDTANCNAQESCHQRVDYHLGYRFKIRKNREMLIVLKKEDADLVQDRIESCLPAFKKEGVYFATSRNNELVFLPVKLQDQVKDYNYDYIVFPTEKDAKDSVSDNEHWLSHFPFRLLVGGKENNQQTCGPKSIAYDELINALSCFPMDANPQDNMIRNMVFSLKNIVYRDWLKDLKAHYLSGNDSDNPLHMFIKTDDDQKSTNYLFQDYDLYQYLFQSFWDSKKVAGLFLRAKRREASQTNKESFTDLNNPISIDDKLFRFRPETIKPDDIKNCISNVSGSICAIIRKILDAAPKETACKERENIIAELTNAMESRYGICDFLLRGNHNNCTTLPDVFISEESHPNIDHRMLNANPGLENTLILHTDKTYANICKIKYQRHLKTSLMYSDCIYAEQLSGIQSFFSLLNNYICNLTPGDASLFVRMAENALLRVLIIDERVSKFLTNHPSMRAVFLNMNISAMDFSEIKDCLKESIGIKEEVFNIDLEKLPLFYEYSEGQKSKKMEKKWDVLIIHQGVIDKWFSRHSKTDVGKLIGNLQEKVMYTVITSGRGRPDNIPDYIKVLPFSTIESTLFNSCPEKMILTSTIMNLLPLS